MLNKLIKNESCGFQIHIISLCKRHIIIFLINGITCVKRVKYYAHHFHRTRLLLLLVRPNTSPIKYWSLQIIVIIVYGEYDAHNVFSLNWSPWKGRAQFMNVGFVELWTTPSIDLAQNQWSVWINWELDLKN